MPARAAIHLTHRIGAVVTLLVLMSLAKNRALSQVLNSRGWNLVLALVESTPRIVREISAGKRDEIRDYQSEMALAWA